MDCAPRDTRMLDPQNRVTGHTPRQVFPRGDNKGRPNQKFAKGAL
jgi:hypothetical protein